MINIDVHQDLIFKYLLISLLYNQKQKQKTMFPFAENSRLR
jgi:hypothetical protein